MRQQRSFRNQARQVRRRRRPGRRTRRRRGAQRRAWRRREQRRTRRRRGARVPRNGWCGRWRPRRGGGLVGGKRAPRRSSRGLGRASRVEGPVGRAPRALSDCCCCCCCCCCACVRRWWWAQRGMWAWACLQLGRRGPSGGWRLRIRLRRGSGGRGAKLALFSGVRLGELEVRREGAYSRLPSCVRAGQPTPSSSGYRTRAQSGHARRSQAGSRGAPMKAPVWYSCAGGCRRNVS